MGSTLDDVVYDQYLQDQAFIEEIKNKAQEEIKNKNDEFYLQASDLFLNLSQSSLALTYEENLNKSIKENLWDYGVLTIWKTIILFCYEKMFQIFTLGDLNKKFLDNLKNNNRDCINCFSFNSVEDKFIADNLIYIWRNLDKNYQNTFRALLDERNSLSHVNQYEYSEIKFMAYLEKALELVEYLENLHLKSITKIIDYIKKNNHFPNLCEKEVEELLKAKNEVDLTENILPFLLSLVRRGEISERLIDSIKQKSIEIFTKSESFTYALKNGKNLILPLIPNFNKDDYISLLGLIYENQRDYSINQIINAAGIEDILIELFENCYNNDPSIKKYWKGFIESAESLKQANNLKNLKKRIIETF